MKMTALWRYVAESYEYHYPTAAWDREAWEESRRWPEQWRPLFRPFVLLRALGFLRGEEAIIPAGYVWEWRFWLPDPHGWRATSRHGWGSVIYALATGNWKVFW